MRKERQRKDHFTRSRFNDQLVTRFVNNCGMEKNRQRLKYFMMQLIESKNKMLKTIIRNLERCFNKHASRRST
jgi:hypothetical protein